MWPCPKRKRKLWVIIIALLRSYISLLWQSSLRLHRENVSLVLGRLIFNLDRFGDYMSRRDGKPSLCCDVMYRWGWSWYIGDHVTWSLCKYQWPAPGQPTSSVPGICQVLCPCPVFCLLSLRIQNVHFD